MKASEIAIKINGELIGDPDLEISSIASIDDVAKNGLAFSVGKSNPESLSRIPRESLLLIPAASAFTPACSFIKVGNPKLAFARLARELVPPLDQEGTHETASIGDGAEVFAAFVGANVSIGKNARIGKGTRIFENVAVGDGVAVGENSILYPNVVIYAHCEIGSECVIHSGAVIGAAGFGYVRDDGEIVQFPQIGNVVIEDGVEIGANTCVDRGALGETRIGENTKIDNLVQVAHNVSIGRRVLIAAQVGISGSVVIEDDVLIGGQVGIGDHAKIKSGAVLGGGTSVFSGKIVRAGFWAGNPAQPIKKYKEQIALMRSFARLKKDIKEEKKNLD